VKIFAETERLILRELLPEDEARLFELDADPEVHRYLGNNPITSREQVAEVIKMVRQQYIDNGIGRWAVIEKNTNAFIGWTGLKLMRELTNNHINYYDLGYRFIKRYWGKGYATETAIESLRYGFTMLNAAEIIAIADVENEGSKNVIEKAGLTFIETFTYDGTLHNWYKITLDEWKKKNENGY
jgi:ribosomal-protein-alanine N-acetyltransferase